MQSQINRRQFLQTTGLTAAGIGLFGQGALGKSHSPNEKLNIGVIGVANRGGANLNGVAGENIVGLCDVDENYLAAAAKEFPKAKRYNDFRKLLERNDLDAVVVSTPDHCHANATMTALKSGRHVYCEKPLTHTVSEARMVAETAQKHNRVTQMGTQIHAGNNYRRVVELIRTGAIGKVREVHCWVGSVWSGHGREINHPPVPDYLHWDLWLGPAEHHQYSPAYAPGSWRAFWDFGGGAMADMGCHHMDLPFWALDLRHPSTISADGPPAHPEFAPRWQIVDFEFPPRGAQPPVHLTWYNGNKRPHYFAEGKLPEWGNGTLFVGEKGMLLADYGKHVLLPEEKFADFKPPEPFIPDSIGHHQEWIQACKTGGSTTCHFGYSGALTETVLLGNVSYRLGKKLRWDPLRLEAINAPEAQELIQHHYRQGWQL